MSTYIFILGKDPELSVAELYAVYPEALFECIERDFLIMQTDSKIDQKAFNRLGGLLKAAEMMEETEKPDLKRVILEALLKDHRSGKLNYGLSFYGYGEENLRAVLIDLKKLLKSANISSRFANQNFKNLTIAQHKGLDGPEALVAKSGDRFFVGKVVATQDIDAYSKRDFQKPFRDMKVGMLPPKLAQIMLNLTGSDGPIWDPFCGGGVLIMEGLLMGGDMLGSDINAATLEGAAQNVDWARHEFSLNSKATLFTHDATDPVPDIHFDAVAFEGYLGPLQSRPKPERELAILISGLDQLYIHFFQQLKKVHFKGPIVAALPFFRANNGREIQLSCVEKIQALGFELQNLLPHKKITSLKYARTDQLVGREIYKIQLMN